MFITLINKVQIYAIILIFPGTAQNLATSLLLSFGESYLFD